jgi:anaerobic magnesium-protoporphyrin IX monomethyl ester cyclase
MLIGFQDQTNLGLGYLSSVLGKRRFAVKMVDFRESPDDILEEVRATKPLLIGFSLIFQYFLPQFGKLASYLRDNGVDCHFCAGGHYPSMRYAEMLAMVPALDSIVRCEGELTLAELVTCLAEGRDWRQVTGIAYRTAAGCIATPPRALIAELDDLPYPDRPFQDRGVLGKKTCFMLASRGCARNCAFCSIRQFYRNAPGKIVRVRDPAKVVEEMRVLHTERSGSIFQFHDDDFPVWGGFGQRWVEQFIEALRNKGLTDRIMWKISCRADEVEPELFSRMREAGLYAVYLGLESGNADGLRTLNKNLTVEKSLRAISVLKALDLFVCYGFMLFDPSSSFASVRANVSFLRQIVGDGSMEAHFCRMVPYAGTPIEASLAQEARLRGGAIDPSYDFLDPRMDEFFNAIDPATTGWINHPDGPMNQLTWAWQEYWVIRRLFPPLDGLESYRQFLHSITRRANEYLLDLVEKASYAFEAGRGEVPTVSEMKGAGQRFAGELQAGRDAFVLCNQQTMLSSLEVAA